MRCVAPPSCRPPLIVTLFVPMPSISRAERDEEMTEVLDVRLAGGVAQHGRARSPRPPP